MREEVWNRPLCFEDLPSPLKPVQPLPPYPKTTTTSKHEIKEVLLLFAHSCICTCFCLFRSSKTFRFNRQPDSYSPQLSNSQAKYGLYARKAPLEGFLNIWLTRIHKQKQNRKGKKMAESLLLYVITSLCLTLSEVHLGRCSQVCEFRCWSHTAGSDELARAMRFRWLL